jgi:hypothetical protein
MRRLHEPADRAALAPAPARRAARIGADEPDFHALWRLRKSACACLSVAGSGANHWVEFPFDPHGVVGTVQPRRIAVRPR